MFDQGALGLLSKDHSEMAQVPVHSDNIEGHWRVPNPKYEIYLFSTTRLDSSRRCHWVDSSTFRNSLETRFFRTLRASDFL